MDQESVEFGERIHSEVTLAVSPDYMEARVILRGQYDPRIDYNAIIERLDAQGITYGLDRQAIGKLLDEYRTHPERRAFEAVVARGQPPAPGVDGKLEMLIEEKPPVAIDETGKADFRNIQRYNAVDPGQVLARYTPPTPGTPGLNIRLEEVPPPPPFDPKIAAGDNVQFHAATGEYRATVHGIFVHEKNTVSVNPVLTIPGNVGLASGNVAYDGNIRIFGNIERGSMVSCLGDLEVGGMIESHAVRAGGSLRVKKGINTRREGMVTTGGNLQAVYIENSDLTVNGSLIVEKSVINSKVVCDGDIALTGRGSTIAGSEICCFGSLACDVMGSPVQNPVRIELGSHSRNKAYYEQHVKELEDVERVLEKKTEDINKIKIYVQRMRGKIPVEKQAAFRVVYNEYRSTVELRQRLQLQVLQFRESRFNSSEVRLIIRDTIHPGATIVYRESVEKITAPQTRVVFRFRPGHAMQMEAFQQKG